MSDINKINKYKILLYFQLFISSIILPLFWLDAPSIVYQVILLLVFIECIVISFVQKQLNVFQLFLFMMFFFNIAQPIFVLFGWYEYPSNNMIMYNDGVRISVSDYSLAETYKVLITLTLGASIGWLKGLLKFRSVNPKLNHLSLKTINFRNRKLYKYIFVVLLVLSTIYSLIRLYYSLLFGYKEVMHLNLIFSEIDSLLMLANIFYPMSGYSMLFMSRSKNEYIKYSILFIIPFFIQMFTGLRGESIAIFLTVIFIYSYNYKEISIIKLIPTGAVLLLIANIIGSYRYSRSLENFFSEESIFRTVISNIAAYSSSMGVIAYVIEIKEEFFNKIPFLFGYIHALFSFAPNYTYEGIQEKNYLAQHLTYLIDPNKLYGGSTIGTAMGAEFYEFANGSMVVILILSITVMYFACYFVEKLYKNQMTFYFGALYIQMLFLSPRGSIMKIFNKESIISIIFIAMINLLSRSRK